MIYVFHYIQYLIIVLVNRCIFYTLKYVSFLEIVIIDTVACSTYSNKIDES